MNNERTHDKISPLDFIIHEYVDGTEGEFVWGQGRDQLFERFYSADEIADPKIAERELQSIIEKDPLFIDAYNSLGCWEIEFQNYGNAQALFKDAYSIGYRLIPKEFSEKIIWGITDNRPFLRAMHGLGICSLLTNNFYGALRIFNRILKYNPNDNQGIRALAVHCYMALGRFKSIIDLCQKYPEDTLPETMYGRVFAYHRLGKLDKASMALSDALQWLPLVAKELVKSKRKAPKSKYPGSVISGGADEAYEYWKRLGQYWTDPALLDFLKAGLSHSQS